MFYSVYLFGKKGPLANVWLAAHWDRKLNKNRITKLNVSESVALIISQELMKSGHKLPVALRISGHLLLGVVRIYSKQVGYLYADCTDAVVKMRQAFRAGDVDLPREQEQAREAAITLRPTYDPVQFDLDDIDVNFADLMNVETPRNLAQPNEITLAEQSLEAEQHALSSLGSLQGFDELPAGGGEWDVEVARAASLAPAPPLRDMPMDSLEMMAPAMQDTPKDVRMSLYGAEQQEFFANTPRDDILARVSELSVDVQQSSEQSARLVAATPRLPKRFTLKQDDRTQIPKPKRDYSSLLRDLEYAPPAKRSREEQELHDMDADDMLLMPNLPGIASDLVAVLRKATAGGALESESSASDSVAQRMSSLDEQGMDLPNLSLGGEPMEWEQDIGGEPGSIGGDLSGEEEGERGLGSSGSAAADSESDSVFDSGRAKKFHRYLTAVFEAAATDTISFDELVAGRNRITVAGSFSELLSFKSKDLVDLQQSDPYDDITIRRLQRFTRV